MRTFRHFLRHPILMAVALFDGTRVPEKALQCVSECLKWVNKGQRRIGIGTARAVLVCLEFDSSEMNPRDLVNPLATRSSNCGLFKYVREDATKQECLMSKPISTPKLGANGTGMHVFVNNVQSEAEGADLLDRLGLPNEPRRRVNWCDIMTMRDTAAAHQAVIVMYPVACVPAQLACSRGPSDPLRAAKILCSLPSPQAGT